MACNAASPVSTKEDTNYELVTHLLVHVGTRVLRNLFDEKIPPDELKDHLSRKENKDKFKRLNRDGILTTHDLAKLRKSNPSSAFYDIQLLTKLLSCICDLSPPCSTGDWKKWPNHEDESISAYIVRMRCYRNQIHGHETSTSMDDEQFEKHWKKISCAIIALAGREKERYTNEIRQLKQRSRESHETIQKLENLEGIVQSHVNSTSAEFKEVKGMVQSHVNSTSAEFKEVKGMVQSHVNSTSSEFKEVKGTLTANQERTEKLLQALLERGVTHRGAENTPKLSKDLK